jgi:arylformamidase
MNVAPASVAPGQGIVDLSRPLHSGMPVFPEDPEVAFEPASAMAPWRVTSLSLGSHSGTHIDAAAHFVPGGTTIDQYPLERFILQAHVVPLDLGPGAAVPWASICPRLPDRLEGQAVLLHTGWDRYWGTEQALDHPYLAEDAAQALAAAGAGLVGTDALNVDGTAAGTTHAHAALLGADVLIVENLTRLDILEPGRPCTCVFVPLRLEGADGSPIRAYALTGDG